MKKVFFMLLLSMFLLLLACSGENEGSEVDSQKSKEIRLAHTLPQSHPVHQAYVNFGQILEEITDGKYKLVVYSDGQLGNQNSAIQLTQSGGLELVHANIAVLESFNPVFSLLTLPYIFKDYDHFVAVMTDPKIREFYQILKPTGFMPLVHLEGGARSMYTKEPIRTPADMEGMKIRVMESPTQIEMIELMGGSPVAMNPGDIYTALQQNVIDGAENNSPTFESQKHYEVTKNYSKTEHARLSDILSISSMFWDSLSSEDQANFIEAANAMTDNFSAMWAENELKSDQILKDAGVEYIEVDSDSFRELVLPMHDAFGAKSEENQQWLNWVRSLEK